MSGNFASVWQATWGGLWRKLANTAHAPEDLFIPLLQAAEPFLNESPSQATRELAYNDPKKARQAFRNLKGHSFKREASILSFLESANAAINDFGVAGLAERYKRTVRSFIATHNLPYRIVDPFKVRILLPAAFAAMYAELERLYAANPLVAEQLEDFEHSFDTFSRSEHVADLKACIEHASKYAEGVVAICANHKGTFGDHCNSLKCWPHVTIREAIKKLYGFCSDYPGLRHNQNITGKLRNLQARDAILLSLALFSFSSYVPETAQGVRLLAGIGPVA